MLRVTRVRGLRGTSDLLLRAQIDALKGHIDQSVVDFLISVLPVAAKAEEDLFAWAELVDAGIVAGIEPRARIEAYNDAAVALYQAQLGTYGVLRLVGYDAAGDFRPFPPPVFGAEVVPLNTGWVRAFAVVLPDIPFPTMSQIKRLHVVPTWLDIAKAWYDRAKAGAPVKGLGVVWVPLAIWATKAIIAGLVVAGTTYVILDAISDVTTKANEQILEYERIEVTKNKDREQLFQNCVNDLKRTTPPPTGGELLHGIETCSKAVGVVVPPGSGPPTGFFQDLVPIIKWGVVGVLAVLIGKALIERRDNTLHGYDYWLGKRVRLHPGLDVWMRGDHYGVVIAKGNKGRYKVKLDKSGKTVQLPGNRFDEI